VISSSRIKSDRENPILGWIQGAESTIRQGFPQSLYARVDIFRGDSWQLVLKQPSQCLRIALLFRTILQSTAGIDTRIAIGIGPVDFLPQDNISTGTGTAFTLSGKGLQRIQDTVRMSIDLPQGPEEGHEGALNTVLNLIDLQAQRWTRKQAQAVSGALLDKTQQQIADCWTPEPVSQQAISQHLDSAGWTQIRQGVEFVEDTLIAIFENNF
jgi:hypothetical protein